MGMLTNPFQFGAAAVASISFIDTKTDTVDRTTYTFTAQSIGAASATRIVVVAAHTDGAQVSVSTASIGGVSATIIKQAANGQPTANLVYAVVPTGTTGDVVITWTGAATRCFIGTWVITDASSPTPIDTDAPARNTSGSGTVTLDLPTGSVGVAAISNGATSNFNSWGVGAEAYDSAVETQMTASATTLTGTGSLAVAVTATHSSDSQCITGATWQ